MDGALEFEGVRPSEDEQRGHGYRIPLTGHPGSNERESFQQR